MRTRRIKSIAITSAIISVMCFGYKVDAYQEKTNVESNVTIVGDTYEKKKIKTPKEFNSELNSDKPKEVKDDLGALYNIDYLKLKTDAKYEVALAYENGEYTYLDNTNDIDLAIDIANDAQKKVKSNVIPVVINEDGLVVYTTDGIGRIVKIIDGKPVVDGDNGYNKYTANIYKTQSTNSSYTYINHSYIDDAPIIENNGKRSKIQVNGIVGWIDNEDEEGLNIIFVPMNQVKNLSSFEKDNNGTLHHYISFDIENKGKGNKRSIGVAPSFMQVGKKYYSYDSKYFYTNINDLNKDLEENTNKRAVNSNSPYYNYYTHVPARHKSVYSVNEINNYISNNTPKDSVLRNKGKAFIDAEEKYGVSANLMLGVSMNESGRGTSKLSKEKNNIFGLNAVDSSPGESANYFPSIEACIEDFAKNWMNKGIKTNPTANYNGYLNPESWKYKGSNLGNKLYGINVSYASDPYWGEKAADFMYRMDRYISGNGKLIDYNRYQLGMYTSETEVKDSANNTLYSVSSTRNKSGEIGDTLIVLSESNGKTELYPDRVAPLDQEIPNLYDWNKRAYVNYDSVTFINEKDGMLREFKNFTANNINMTSTTVSGKGISGATVKVYVDGTQIGSTSIVDSNDNYKINIPKQKVGTKVKVEISKLGYKTTQKTLTVLKMFDRFSVNDLTSKATTITGKGVNGATVKAYVNGKQIGKVATVDSKGNYKISIPEQKSNTSITINMSKTGYETASKSTVVISTISNIKSNLTKDINKYDAGNNKYLTYINGRGYSQFSYVNKAESYAFTPSSWMQAAGLSVTMPTNANGYMMIIDNDYIEMSKDAENLLGKIKSNKISYNDALAELSVLKEKDNNLELQTLEEETITSRSTPKATLTKDIHKYDAGDGRYLTYINGKGYSQFSYLNKVGSYAFTPSSWMKAAGLNVTKPNKDNGYKMTIDNPYVGKYNDLIKKIETSL